MEASLDEVAAGAKAYFDVVHSANETRNHEFATSMAVRWRSPIAGPRVRREAKGASSSANVDR